MIIDQTTQTLTIQGRQFRDSIPNYRLLWDKSDLTGPITRYYHWPSKYPSPMRHQVATADFMCRHQRGYIFNDIGTGKTLSFLWYFDYLKRQKHVRRALVLAPLSTLYTVHGSELRWSLSHLSWTILHGTKEKRLSELSKDKDVYIINYDGVKIIGEALAGRDDIDCIFIDELAILRNSQTKLWKVINSLYGYQEKNKLVWGLTGSPMPKAPTDCYAQAKMIRPDLLPRQLNWRTKEQEPIPFYKFRERVMYAKNEYKWLPRTGWEKVCYSILQPSIRFLRDECIDLPPCVTETREIEMTSHQRTLYKTMMRELAVEIDGQTIEAVNEGVKLQKLLQITAGAIYDGRRKNHFVDCDGKLKAARQIIDACAPGHVIIFAPYRNILPYIVKALDKSYGQGSAALVDSAVSASSRTVIYNQFTKGNLRFIVAIPSCMSHGLNLHDQCSTIIWWSPPGKRYDIKEQADGRIKRPGQEKKQLVVHLQCAPVERECYKDLANKDIAQSILLRLLKEV